MNGRVERGFTLIELLVVVSIIGLLASMLLPALSNAKAKAKEVKCLNNLKQIGIATLSYAHDNRDVLQINSPLQPQNTWASLLSTNVNLQSFQTFLCPSYPPTTFSNWFRIYGVRLDPPTNNTLGNFHEFLAINTVQAPSDYLHVADTTSRGRQGIAAQQFYCFRFASENEVHARHNHKANGLFLDGHVESCGRHRLEILGITALFDADTVPGYFP